VRSTLFPFSLAFRGSAGNPRAAFAYNVFK